MPDYTSVKTSKLASQIVPQPVKEIPRILRDPKFHYSANNSPPLVSVLGQISPIRALLSDLFYDPLVSFSHVRLWFLPLSPPKFRMNSPLYVPRVAPIPSFLIIIILIFSFCLWVFAFIGPLNISHSLQLSKRVKFFIFHAMKAYRGSRGIAPFIP